MSKPTSLDYMLAADGELDAAERDGLAARPGYAAEDAAATADGVAEVGALVRGHLELAADEAEPRLADLWDLIERRLDVAEDTAAEPVRAPARPPGWFARARAWMSGYRSHLATGLVSAGAVAALALALQPDPPERVVIKTVQVPAIAPVILTASPPEIESVDVEGGTGTVFTVAGEGDEGETAVIWVEPDDPTEGI